MSLVVWLETCVAIGGTATTSILALKWWSNYQRFKSLQTLPCLKKYLFFGNALQLSTAVKQKKYFQLLYDLATKFNSTFAYWVGNTPVVILSDPRVIETTIVNGMKAGYLVRTKKVQKAWNDISGPILLGQDGADWQWRRKTWNPEFTSKALSKHILILEKVSNDLILKIKQNISSKKVVKVDELFVELTMRVIASLLLGIPVDQNRVNKEGPPLSIVEAYKAMSVLGYRFLRVATGEKEWMKYLPIKSSFNYWKSRKYLEKLIVPRVELALQMRDKSNFDLENIDILFKESMLVKIAAKQPKYDKDSLVAESLELFLAGTDTTAHSLSFAIAQLGLNSEVYEKAQKIVDRTWEKYGGINCDSFEELNYITAIFKETLRLYPVAGATSLEVKHDMKVNEDLIVPEGGRIYWSLLAAGRNPKFYPEPEKFIPERWLKKNYLNNFMLTIAFGFGLHRCLGEHLALLEGTIVLAMLLRYFNWELVNNNISLKKLEHNLSIYPPDGMPVRFTNRDINEVLDKSKNSIY
ncbi:MAG: cytochrome P450 [Prochloraceae cyanobacterium]